MCLGVPAVILDVDYDKMIAVVDYGDGIPREVLVGVSSERIKRGDIVIIHAGVIVSKMSEEEILEQIEFFKNVLGEEANEYFMRYLRLLNRLRDIKGGV